MPLPLNKIPPSQVLNFTFNYFFNASRKTNIRSKQQATQMRSEELRLTPQTVGNFARRISIIDQFSKTQQQRFIDIFT